MFEGPAHTTGKKPELSRTEPQKTEPLYVVFSGLQPVATTVFNILTKKKTAENRFEPVATDYGLVQYNSLQYLIYMGL